MRTNDRLMESWDGRDYERHSSHQRAWGSSLIEELALRGDERILDLGCGDGSVTRQLAERVPHGSVLGIDAAAEMLDAARDKCGPNMTVQHLDMNDLAFETEFDVVFSNAALHWVHDHAAVLRNIHRALRPGGVLLAQFGCDGNCPNILVCLHRQMAIPPFPEAFAGFRWPWFFPTLPAYEDLLRASLFAEWRARTERRDQRFPSPDAIVGWIDNPCLLEAIVKYRALGRTGLKVSELGFGCGSVGGLLVRGEYPEMRRAVARALELGITYFDTASLYGDGQSEVNLGAVLRELGADPIVGTKVRLKPPDLDRIEAAIAESVEASLRRLGRERVDLVQLHNPLVPHSAPDWAGVTLHCFPAVLRAFEALQRQGKVRFWGITGLGETEILHQAVAGGGFHTVQAVYNLLNPSTGWQAPSGFPYQDYRQLIDRAASRQMGVIAIRVLAGGALSGSPDRHPVGARSVVPIATERDYSADVARARRFAFLVEDGTVGSLVEAAIRFVISTPEISTALVGISSLEQLEQAVGYANRGPLPAEALGRLHGG